MVKRKLSLESLIGETIDTYDYEVGDSLALEARKGNPEQLEGLLDVEFELIRSFQAGINETISKINELLFDNTIVTSIKEAIESREIGSKEYFYAIETYNPIMKRILKKYNFKYHVISTEDFKNPIVTKYAHDIAIEGLAETIKAIWEKIKKFIRELWEKIKLIVKKLLNLDLTLGQYEETIEEYLAKARENNRKLESPVKIDTKLPQLLSDSYLTNTTYGVYNVLDKGKRKIEALTLILTTTDRVSANIRASLNQVVDNIKSSDITNKINEKINEIDYIFYDPDSTTQSISNKTNEKIEGIFKELGLPNLMSDGKEILGSLFSSNVPSKLIPEDVYDEIINKLELINDRFNRNEGRFDEREVVFFSLIDNSLVNLPADCNYYIGKYNFIVAGKEYKHYNTSVESAMYSAKTYEELDKLYTIYKNMKSKVKPKALSSFERSLNDHISNILDSGLESVFKPILENLKSKLNKAEETRKKLNDTFSPDERHESKKEHNERHIYTLKKFEKMIYEVISSIQNLFYHQMSEISSIGSFYSSFLYRVYLETRYELIRFIYKNARLMI